MDTKRRKLIGALALTPFLLSARNINFPQRKIINSTKRLQYSVNAYSFNSVLRSGEMTFFDMLEFAAEIGLNAVDLTGYYFSSYPEIPPNNELFKIKKKALELGLNISWTGVRNDFVNPNEVSRSTDKEMIKQWLNVSSKLGASIMRIFSGTHNYEGYTKEEVKKWLIDDFKACAKYAEESGVMLGLQNHHDFLFHSDEVIEVLKEVDSEWFGLILDIGSLHSENPYEDIRKLAPYANYWFIKEFVYPNGNKTPVDMKKVASILKETEYQGYVSFENLSDDHPKKNNYYNV